MAVILHNIPKLLQYNSIQVYPQHPDDSRIDEEARELSAVRARSPLVYITLWSVMGDSGPDETDKPDTITLNALTLNLHSPLLATWGILDSLSQLQCSMLTATTSNLPVRNPKKPLLTQTFWFLDANLEMEKSDSLRFMELRSACF